MASLCNISAETRFPDRLLRCSAPGRVYSRREEKDGGSGGDGASGDCGGGGGASSDGGGGGSGRITAILVFIDCTHVNCRAL